MKSENVTKPSREHSVYASVDASEAQCSEYLWPEKLMGQNSLDKN